MLLERPGELVTREEICQKLWSRDTFVDFDRSLGTAVNKIREVLNDSATEPRFVETLPRRGYRFIATVSPVMDPPETERVLSPPQERCARETDSSGTKGRVGGCRGGAARVRVGCVVLFAPSFNKVDCSPSAGEFLGRA